MSIVKRVKAARFNPPRISSEKIGRLVRGRAQVVRELRPVATD